MTAWRRRGDTRTTTEKGYGTAHQRARARVALKVKAGAAFCARCGGWIMPGSAWHLDHDETRSGYLGPSHAKCNERAGARKGNARRSAQALAQNRTSRVW